MAMILSKSVLIALTKCGQMDFAWLDMKTQHLRSAVTEQDQVRKLQKVTALVPRLYSTRPLE